MAELALVPNGYIDYKTKMGIPDRIVLFVMLACSSSSSSRNKTMSKYRSINGWLEYGSLQKK